MKRSLVSVITPCYNGAKYISRLLDSVSGQSYEKIEMIVVDDGSTDNSADIIKSFVDKFDERGYKLTYLFQENQGQSAAVNRALKKVSGEYLVWPDADDFYSSPRSIEKMVDALKASDETVSMVRVHYEVLDDTGKVIDQLAVNENTKYKTDLFEDAVLGRDGFWYPPGGYMAKVSKIDELIPNREIYTEKNAGQNFQLYLPLLYGHSCLTVEEFLYRIVAHEDSHSRNMSTNNERQKMYRRTIKNTLDKMPLDHGYKSYLMREVEEAVEKNSTYEPKKLPLRRYAKMAVRGLLPHGVVVLYRRVFK